MKFDIPGFQLISVIFVKRSTACEAMELRSHECYLETARPDVHLTKKEQNCEKFNVIFSLLSLYDIIAGEEKIWSFFFLFFFRG